MPETLPFSGQDWNNKIIRRSFLKRTGGATLATIAAWNLTSTSSEAAAPTASQSGNYVWSVTYATNKEKVALLTTGPDNMTNSQKIQLTMSIIYADGDNGDDTEKSREEKNIPGTELNPRLYSAVQGSPTIDGRQVTFPAGFTYKVTFRN